MLVSGDCADCSINQLRLPMTVKAPDDMHLYDAEENVQANWNTSNASADAYILK